MAYEREIREAKLIGEGWIKETTRYQKAFNGAKKTVLAPQKKQLAVIQKAVDQARFLQMRAVQAKYKKPLAKLEKALRDFLREGEEMFGDHERWALEEPRASMKVIGPRLDLGNARSEPYQAVAVGCKKMLSDVAKGIAETQRMWKSDLKPALENQIDKTVALRDILERNATKADAFTVQFEKEKARFMELCERTRIGATGKITTDVAQRQMAQKVIKGQAEPTLPMPALNQLHQVYEKKRDTAPKLVATIEKNYNRILKSIPREFLTGLRDTPTFDEMAQKAEDTILKIRTSEKFYREIAALFEEAGFS